MVNKIDKGGVLRLLAYNSAHNLNNTPVIDELVNECILEAENASQFRYIYKIFDINGCKLEGTDIYLNSRDIKAHLEGSSKCLVLAATIGVGVDRLISKYEITNITKAVIIDACGSVAAERAQTKAISEAAQALMSNKGMGCNFMTSQYSPGYGDFPISMQNKIIDILQAQKTIGLTVTENHIMIPRKSITSLTGISGQAVSGKLSGCKNCVLYNKCKFKKN
ncbi:MAG: hypothetical protein LBV08_03920 [Clostridiales bacterium]|jgi:hypothetical protein|nr:hypothetical protein [Clostridiales bacterium]